MIKEITNNLTPKNDLIFKKIFGSKGSEGILKSFLESILEIKIKEVKLRNRQRIITRFL